MAYTFEQLDAARQAGYSDDEIAKHVYAKDPDLAKAMDAGYSLGEIYDHLKGRAKTPTNQPAPAEPAQPKPVATQHGPTVTETVQRRDYSTPPPAQLSKKEKMVAFLNEPGNEGLKALNAAGSPEGIQKFSAGTPAPELLNPSKPITGDAVDPGITSASQFFGKDTPQIPYNKDGNAVLEGGKAVANNIIGLADFALSPAGLATLEVGTASKVAGRLIGVPFVAGLSKYGYDQTKEAFAPDKTPAERTVAGVNAVAASAMVYGITSQVLKGDPAVKANLRNDLGVLPKEHLQAFMDDPQFDKYDKTPVQEEIDRRQQNPEANAKADAAAVSGLSETARALRETNEPNPPTQIAPPKQEPSGVNPPLQPENKDTAPGVEGNQSAGPRVLHTVVTRDDQTLSGNDPFTSHADIARQHPGKQGIPMPPPKEESRGFLVRDADGLQRVVGREEALSIAKQAGQLKDGDLEEPGKLHSGDLQADTEKPAGEPATVKESLPVQPDQVTTSIKNAVVDAERVKRGLPERIAPLRRKFGQVWDEAMSAFDRNANAGTELVDGLKDKNRPLTDKEDAILTHEQLTRQDDFNRAVDDVNSAKTEPERVAAEARLAAARDRVFAVYDVGQQAGTANARGLNARRMMIREDFSLTNMEARKRAENKGAKLNDAQLKEVADAHKRIAELEAKVSDYETKRDDGLAKHYFDQLLNENKRDVKSSIKQGKQLTDFLSDQATKARARIRSRGARLNVGLDPVDLVDHAIIGADYIAKGAKAITEWSAQMVKDFGETIRPYLDQIFDKSKEYHDAHNKLFKEPGEPKEKLTPEEVLERAKANADAGKPLSHRTAYDLARAHVNAGVDGFDAVMKATHGDLSKIHEGLTEREVRDSFSEYGKVKFPSKEADKMKLSEYRRVGQLISGIEDALSGKSPLKTGLQRDKPTQTIREKMAELRKAMDEAGIETRSPEQQLASRNTARATALRNQIEDIDKQLRTGEKPAKSPPVPDSPEVKALRAERDAKKDQLKAIEDAKAPPKRTSDQIKLENYKKSLRNQIEDLRDRQARGDYAPKSKNATVLDPEGMRLKIARDAEKQKFEEALIKDRLANRTTGAKMADAAVSWSRVAKLSSIKVFPKLFEAALFRSVFEPLGRVAGQPLRLLAPDVYQKAYPESGASVKAAAKYIATGLTSWGKMWEKLRTGKTDIDVIAGKRAKDAEMLNFVGNAHGMMKEPLRQASFEASKQLRLEQAIRHGLDPNDPIAQTGILSGAVEDANRQVFMGNNVFSRYLIKVPIGALKGSKVSGLPALGRVMEFLMPIVNVSSNITVHAVRLNPLVGFSEFALRMADAYKKGELSNGAAKLSEADAQMLSRVFKTAMLGTVLSAYAWNNPDDFGGVYEEGPRKKGGLKSDEIRLFGVVLPGWMNHAPEILHLNTVASARRVYDRYMEKHPDGKLNADAEVMMFTLLSPVKHFPFIDAYTRLFSNTKSAGRTAGAMVRDAVVPSAVTSLLSLTDKTERQPAGAIDEIKMGIPGLRQDVPEKGAGKPSRKTIPRLKKKH